MDDSNNRNKENIPQNPNAKKRVKESNDPTRDFRFVVTRNTRNAWMDDLYEITPENGSMATFH